MEVGSALQATTFDVGKAFTFLFLSLGPNKIIGPFAEMTRGHDAAFKRGLAFRGILNAALAAVAAVTAGVSALQGWQVSVGSVQLMAGILLFVIALRPVLEMYTPRTPLPARSAPAGAPAADVSALAFSPLAFPMIVPPFGIGVLVVLAMLRPDHMPEIIGVTSFILLLDLLAMLGADFILKVPLIGSLLGIVGAVMGVLQIALGIDVMVEALRDLGLAGGAAR